MGFPFYAGAVINSAMLHQIPMTRSTFGLGFTLLNLFVGLPSIAIARSIERWGVRATFILGDVLICAGSLWRAFLTAHPWQYLVGYGVLIGTGIGFGTNIPLATVISRWFARYRGRAMAIALTASGFGGFVSAPLIGSVVTRHALGFRAGWIVVAGVAIISILIAYLSIKEKPEDLGQMPDGEEANTVAPPRSAPERLVTQRTWTPNEAFNTPAYWLIVIGSIACQYPTFFLVAHWILYLRGNGMSAAAAMWAMSVFTISNVGGRLAGGFLTDIMPARYVFALGLGSYVLASFVTLREGHGDNSTQFMAAVLFGVGFGCSFVCMNTITANYYSHSAVPMLNGVMMLLSSLVCAPAGFVGGRLFDKCGSYVPAFELNLIILFVGIIAVFFAKMPRKRESCRSAAVIDCAGAPGPQC
jgi:MFS family permease